MGEPEPPAPAGHVPVLLDRVLELLGPGAGPARRGARRCHPRPRRPQRGAAAARIRRPPWWAWTATGRRCGSAPSGWPPTPSAPTWCTPSTTSFPRVLADLDLARIDAALFDLGVSSMQLDRRRARLLLRPGRATGHADGRPGPADRRGDRQQLPGAAAGPGAARLRRGAVRAADRPGDRTAARRAPADLDRRTRRTGAPGDPGGDPAHRRPSRQAHLPGPADRGQRRTGRGARPRFPPRCRH